MKIRELYEQSRWDQSEYKYGDDVNPDSPYYDPSRGRGKRSHIGDTTDDVAFDDAQSSENRLRSNLSDEQYNTTPSVPHITTYTAIASNLQVAQRRVEQLRYTVYQFIDSSIDPLPDGRVKITATYQL